MMKKYKDVKYEDLEDFHIRFIVTQLACWEGLFDIQYELQILYDLRLPESELQKLNPEDPECLLSNEWIYLFQKTRADFIQSVKRLPVMNKLRRVYKIQEMYNEFEKKGDANNMLKALEMGRLETEGLFNDFVYFLTVKDFSKN